MKVPTSVTVFALLRALGGDRSALLIDWSYLLHSVSSDTFAFSSEEEDGEDDNDDDNDCRSG